MRLVIIATLGSILLGGCVSKTVEPDISTEVPYLTPVAKLQLDHTRAWLDQHELRILADTVELRVPDDLYEISAFFVKPEFFEQSRRQEVVERGGKPCPIMITEVVALTDAIQVTRCRMRAQEEVEAGAHGLDVAALRRLRVVADPSLSNVTIIAQGNVSWKLDGVSERSGSRTFQIPPGTAPAEPLP